MGYICVRTSSRPRRALILDMPRIELHIGKPALTRIAKPKPKPNPKPEQAFPKQEMA